MPNVGNATPVTQVKPPDELWMQLHAQLTATHDLLVNNDDGYALGHDPYSTCTWLRGVVHRSLAELVDVLGDPS